MLAERPLPPLRLLLLLLGLVLIVAGIGTGLDDRWGLAIPLLVAAVLRREGRRVLPRSRVAGRPRPAWPAEARAAPKSPPRHGGRRVTRPRATGQSWPPWPHRPAGRAAWPARNTGRAYREWRLRRARTGLVCAVQRGGVSAAPGEP